MPRQIATNQTTAPTAEATRDASAPKPGIRATTNTETNNIPLTAAIRLIEKTERHH